MYMGHHYLEHICPNSGALYAIYMTNLRFIK